MSQSKGESDEGDLYVIFQQRIDPERRRHRPEPSDQRELKGKDRQADEPQRYRELNKERATGRIVLADHQEQRGQTEEHVEDNPDQTAEKVSHQASSASCNSSRPRTARP